MRWTYSEVGGLDPESFVKPQHVQFRSFDGRQIPAYYFRPRGASRERPAAVLIRIHGGPESQFRPFFSGSLQFEVNELGLAVICPNVRGSAGYGKTYLKLDNAELREDSVKDIGALLDWVAQQPELDARRVAVTGGSYGGFMVLSSLTHYPERIKAGIDNVGHRQLHHLSGKHQPLPAGLAPGRVRRRAEAGDAGRFRADQSFRPGRQDPLGTCWWPTAATILRVPFSEAEQIVAKVRANGRQVWTVYADNEGHGFRKKDNRDYLTAVEMLFLDKALGLSAVDGKGD